MYDAHAHKDYDEQDNDHDVYNDYDDHDNNIPTVGPEAGLCGREPAPSLNSFLSLTLSSCPEEMFTCDR